MRGIHISFEDIEAFAIKRNLVKSYIRDIIVGEGYKQGEISLIFCSDHYLLEVNRNYLKHDFYTDIITFNYSSLPVISGDLFISIDRVKDNAEQFAVSFLHELMRVIFHGILHMVGYDDKSDMDQESMRKKENEYLEKFGIK
ncbi:probable rRNA maturation factor YbeY [Bacteroidales bacterium 6E]|nr:probable rRNA maturation factor YbeY [Bacteroidales bacterium 6E]